jgi:hypothetical protein
VRLIGFANLLSLQGNRNKGSGRRKDRLSVDSKELIIVGNVKLEVL